MVRLLPQNRLFYDYLAQAAGNARDAAATLAALLTDYHDVELVVRRLEDMEHRGDDISHQTMHALNTTFLTPLDREDIQELLGRIDDFVDFITAAAGRLVLYRIAQPSEQARLFGRILKEQGAAISGAVTLLGNDGTADEMRHFTREIHFLEDEADEVLSETLAGLYEGVHDIPGMVQAIHWKELYQRFESATDRGEAVANTIEGIVLK